MRSGDTADSTYTTCSTNCKDKGSKMWMTIGKTTVIIYQKEIRGKKADRRYLERRNARRAAETRRAHGPSATHEPHLTPGDRKNKPPLSVWGPVSASACNPVGRILTVKHKH
ncbi:rCG55228 [Rattus norvegicus]|uniref:RCG55228 n=1 Tax=Rattus norvegicus TaxID=10116 RepID=A6J7Y2_RAT|nr:rCG55228 [Rattus norvegicus]